MKVNMQLLSYDTVNYIRMWDFFTVFPFGTTFLKVGTCFFVTDSERNATLLNQVIVL